MGTDVGVCQALKVGGYLRLTLSTVALPACASVIGFSELDMCGPHVRSIPSQVAVAKFLLLQDQKGVR